MGPETKFKYKVFKDLKTLKHCHYEKIQQRCIRATLDILCCINGYYVALELKATPQDKLDALQAHTVQKIGKARGIALRVDPENWPEILSQLRLLDDQPESALQRIAKAPAKATKRALSN